MKHLPNLLTLGNLFCGCLAIAYVLTAQPFVYRNMTDGSLQWIMGTEQMYMASLFIAVAAVCDMLDGFTARALNILSPIGKDLDSLADMVTFGVAPSMIMYKCLWDATMQEKNAFDANILSMAPAFLIACFAALRLAKFNITSTEQKSYFIGMPTPAVGLLIGSFPLFIWQNSVITQYLHSKWALYLIIAAVCYFMVSNIKFFKFIPSKFKMPYLWPQLVIIIGTAAAVPFLKFAAIVVSFILYVILSLVYKQPQEAKTN